jgi:hypothetical protein
MKKLHALDVEDPIQHIAFLPLYLLSFLIKVP